MTRWRSLADGDPSITFPVDSHVRVVEPKSFLEKEIAGRTYLVLRHDRTHGYVVLYTSPLNPSPRFYVHPEALERLEP